MKYLKSLSIAFALAAGTCLPAATVAISGSWDGAGKNLNNYFKAWGISPTEPSAAAYVHDNQMPGDEYWQSILSSGDSAIMLLEVAGNANQNSFGIFQVDPQGNKTYTEIFAGSGLNGVPGATASLAIPAGPFGFYLKYSGNGTYFYSDASMNAGGYDQLASYQGPFGGLGTVLGQPWDQQSYLLAWEDLPYASSDKDYNDMVLMIRVKAPDTRKVPDSGSTVLLIGTGLLALAGLRRKLR